ncbi:MAG: secretin N-terminal domain-containing protein [Verrucomicrobiota bacterium]
MAACSGSILIAQQAAPAPAPAAPAPAKPAAPGAPAPSAAAPSVPSVSGSVAATPAAPLLGSDIVGPVILRDETVAQVLELLARWTGKSILRPQALPANVYSLSLPDTATRDDALLALETLLALNGVAVIQQGDKFLKIVPNLVAKAESPSLISESTLKLPPSGRIASKIFTFKHAAAQEVLPTLTGMLNTQLASPPVYFSRNNAVLVTDSVMNLQKIEALVAEIDRPQLDSIVTKVYELKAAMATDVVNKLTALLRTPTTSGGAPFRLSTGTSFTADERTNRVVLMGSADQHSFFDNLISTLDASSDPNTRTEVIFLRNATAQDVATLITQLVTGQTTAAQRANGGSRTLTSRTPVPTPTPVPTAAGAAAATTQQSGANEFSQMLTVLPDIRSNSIVASGTKSDLQLLKDLVEKVDVVLPQVRIECVVAEVTLSDNEQSGINALGLTLQNGKLIGVGGSVQGGSLGGGNGTVVGAAPAQGLLTGSDLSGIISLTSTPRLGDTKFLSVPAVTTSHNKEATIFSGESRPIITGTSTSTVVAGTVTSQVSQREIGIQLRVLPLVGKDGSVQIQLTQTVDDIIGTVLLDGNEQPIIGSRRTESFVSANSGEIIVLGGVQRNVDTKDTTRLGPIPFLGDLFGSSTTKKVRQDLVIFLRPYVLSNTPADSADAVQRVRKGEVGKDFTEVIDRKPGVMPAPEAKKK